MIEPALRTIVLGREPRLHKRRTVIALDKVILKPRQGCIHKRLAARQEREWRSLTIVETLAHYKVAVGVPHLHVFLMVSQLVDALLRKRHEQHVHRHASDGIIFRLDVRVFPPPGVLLRLAFPFRKLGRVRERFCATPITITML